MVKKLDALFEERYHGAGNHRSVLYHALYGSVLGLDLDPLAGTVLNTEGYEDLELENPDGSLVLYQLKCYEKKLDYGDLESIFGSFAEVIATKDVRRCCIVTPSGFPDEVENWQADTAKRSLPSKLQKRIAKVAKGNARISEALSKRVEYVKVTTDGLVQTVSRKVVDVADLSHASQESFLHALCFQMVEWSGERRSVLYQAIADVLSGVKAQFEAGLMNPAVVGGFVVPLAFDGIDPHTADFYEGRAARPGHIAANRDVLRPKALSDIEGALARANVAAVISSSGQGKSALALRHLADRTTEGFAFEVKVCRTAEDASAIAEFVRFRLGLGLGVSLLIDNLSRAQMSWVELAAALAGEQVKIVLTAREEDWRLFAGDLSRVVWQRVTPTLELDEARRIFGNLREAGALHPSMRSAGEAYEKVNEAKLLIEYVYLLTQGELLEERLRHQIEGVSERDEAALTCLRIVSLADQMNLRVEVSRLLGSVPFQGDSQRALQRLEGEYLVVQDGLCSGLHPVRSQHLVRLLHPYGIEGTLRSVLGLVEDEELPEFIYSMLARTDAAIVPMVDAVVERCKGATDFEQVWKSAYEGSEVRHAQACRGLLDDVDEKVGRAAVNLFPLLTPPILGTLDTLEVMQGVMDAERFDALKSAVESVPSRDYPKRFESLIATGWIAGENGPIPLRESLALSKAFWLAENYARANDLINAIDWRNGLLTWPLELASRAAFLLQEIQPEGYADFARGRQDEIIAYLLRETRSLAIRTEGDKLVVSFIVDPYAEVGDNEQAVSRVQATRGLLPGYGRYATDPVRPLEMPVALPHDDAHKDSTLEGWYSKEITDLNRGWIEALEVVTASDSLAGWEWRERAAVLAGMDVLESFAALVEKQDDGRAIYQNETEACARRYQVYESGGQARRELPSTLTQEQKAKLRKVADLYDSLNALLPNVHEELLAKPEGDWDRQQVILSCLRDVYNTAQAAQDGLDFARQTSGLDISQPLVKRLQGFTERLYRRIERRSQIKHGKRVLDSLSSTTADFLHRELENEDDDLAQRVRLARRSLLYTLENEKASFHMPSWLFTLETDTLEGLVLEALRASMVFACAFDSYIGYFVAVPVRRGARVSRRFYRAAAPTLREIVGNQQLDPLSILPIDESGESINALLGLEPHTERPELDLLQPFITSGEQLAFARESSRIELMNAGAPNAIGASIQAQRLEENFAHALEDLRAYRPDERLVAEWQSVLEQVGHGANAVEMTPARFLLEYAAMSNPVDRYLEAALSLEEKPTD